MTVQDIILKTQRYIETFIVSLLIKISVVFVTFLSANKTFLPIFQPRNISLKTKKQQHQ